MKWPFARREDRVQKPRKDTRYEREILQNVEEHGCHITLVFDPDGNDPSYAYSAGFPKTVGQPDLIVFGLPNEVMQFMINETLDQCREGLQLKDWTRIEGLLEGHHCIARAVTPHHIVRDYFNSAMWLRDRLGGEMNEAIQIVWPGSVNGLFPWDSGCADEVRACQPALYEGGTVQ